MALRSRPAEGGFKPPATALAEDRFVNTNVGGGPGPEGIEQGGVLVRNGDQQRLFFASCRVWAVPVLRLDAGIGVGHFHFPLDVARQSGRVLMF